MKLSHLLHAPERRWIILLLAFTILGLVQFAENSTPTQAAGVVTDCSSQAGLATALSSGSGTITFNCNGTNDPATIIITQDGGLVALGGTSHTIDGGNKITLSGANNVRIFQVSALSTLTLTNIILTNGNASGGAAPLPTQGGGILNNGGFLVLNNATVRNSQSTYAAGAIETAAGTTIVMNSLIENNQSDYGGGIDSIGTLTLINTVVRNNHTLTHDGGGLDVGGSVTISNSQIYSNTVNDNNGTAGNGGGLNVGSGGNVTINNSQIYSNIAQSHYSGLGGGGGIYNAGTLTVTQSTLTGNSTTYSGSGGTGAPFGGGGIFNSSGIATLTNVTFNGNSGIEGGGILSYNFGTTTLTNVTFSGNSSTDGGGGIFNFDSTMTITNVTVSGNSAPYGGGIYHYSSTAGKTITLKNTIVNSRVGNSPIPPNCYVYSSSVTNITSSGFNLSSDNSCASYFNQVGDQNNVSAQLGPLANNGGFTLTHLPLPPIVNGIGPIDNGSCPNGSFDQRGVMRPQGAACDIGAVENAQLPQTITFNALANKNLGDPPFAVLATAASGLTVTFTAVGQCTVTGSTVTLMSTGSCTITAHQAGGGDYNAASDVSQRFTISAKLLLPLIVR